MKRKMLMLLLGVCLALSGCGGSKDAPPTGGTPAEAVEEPAEEPEEVESEEPEEQEPVEEPEEEVPQLTYVEEHGLEFDQETSFTLQAVRCDVEDDMSYDFTDEQLKLESIRIEPSEIEGCQTIIIESSASGEIWSNGSQYKNHLSLKSFVLCDMYTGRVLPSPHTEEDMQIDYAVDVEWEGESYNISYTENIEWEWGDWRELGSGIWNSTGTMHVTYAVTISEGYDGLMLWASPVREWDGIQDDVGVINETEKYLLDEWQDGDCLVSVSDMYEILNEVPVEE